MRRTRPILVAALLFSLSPRHGNAQARLTDVLDPARLTAARDSFVILLQGQPAGWQRLVRTRLADGWQLEDALSMPAMVTQGSVMTFDRRLTQRTLRQEGVMQGRPMKISLDYAGGRASGRALTPSNPSGEIAIDTVISAGTVDDNAVLPLLVAVRWRDSLTIATPMLTSGKGTIENTQLRVIAPDRVTVPAGTFDTWRVEMKMGRSTSLVDITRDAPYRIVRVRLGPQFEMQLLK
jgi:hypothetical protein